VFQIGAWTEYFSEMKFNLKTCPIVIVRWKDATEPFSGWVEFKDRKRHRRRDVTDG
jgi:hypothetical protein